VLLGIIIHLVGEACLKYLDYRLKMAKGENSRINYIIVTGSGNTNRLSYANSRRIFTEPPGSARYHHWLAEAFLEHSTFVNPRPIASEQCAGHCLFLEGTFLDVVSGTY